MYAVVRLGLSYVGSSTLWYCITEPNVMVDWQLSGPGSLTPIAAYSNASGVAMVKWSADAAIANQTYTITARKKNGP